MSGPRFYDPMAYFECSYVVDAINGCWVWQRNCTTRGYGRMSVLGQRSCAHRFSLQVATGQSGDGLYACHRCDNPPCVNPQHLFWGSQKENLADMVAKGRHNFSKPKSFTHCPSGHLLDEKNKAPKVRPGSNSYECRECGRQRHARKVANARALKGTAP